MDAEAALVSARMRLLYDYRAPAGTRWSPTAEQLRELLSLFHVGGLRTPSTAQISHITARLRVHGRIEGRNVFYWFQNQKARERKRRLQLMQAASSTCGLPSENTTSSMDDARSLPPQSEPPPPEGLQSAMIMHIHEQVQPKHCHLQDAHFEAGRRSSGVSTPEEISWAVPLHQLSSSCKHQQARRTDTVAERVVEMEEDNGLLVYNLQKKIKHAHFNSTVAQAFLTEDVAGEDEKSEVSDANVQHSASPFTNFILRRIDKMLCPGDEIDSVATEETLMQQAEVPVLHALVRSTGATSPALPALTLFPLSPSSSSPPHNHHHKFLSSSSYTHGQNQDLKGTCLSPSLYMQSSLLDLKLAIDS